MSLPKYKIYKMNDSSESNRVSKEGTWDLPMRLIICGRSLLSGKTNFLGNLALRPYGDDDVDAENHHVKCMLANTIFFVEKLLVKVIE